MSTLNEIESRAKLYAEARESLAAIVSELNAGIEALKRQAMPTSSAPSAVPAHTTMPCAR